ncbi:MAG: ABC transporter ATP-binding protein, partial [Anaerolineae bacterium]|nr:ABC transporter ATP-binding protein [Anaerolineae bacterium]
MTSLRRILRFARPYRLQALLAMLLIIGVTATDLAAPRLTQRIIDEGLAQGKPDVITSTALLMVGAAVLGALLAVANTIYSVRVSQSFGADVRSALVHKVQTFSFGNLDRLQTGQLIVRATSDINQLQMIVMLAMRMLVRAPLWIIGSVVMLLIGSPQMMWIMVALIPVIFGLMGLFAGKARPLFLLVQAKLDRLNEVLQENMAGVRVVKAFVRADHENTRFDGANDDLTAQSIRVHQFLAVLIPSVLMIVNLAMVAAVWLGGTYVINERLTVGQLLAALNYLTRALFPLVMLGGMIGPLSAADASAGRILEVL